jgi:hypothetical protein
MIKHNETLNLNKNVAKKYISALVKQFFDDRGLHSHLILSNNNNAALKDDIVDDLSVEINYCLRSKRNFIFSKVDDTLFLKCISTIYHEEQHLMQSCIDFYSEYPSDDIIQMAIRRLARENNEQYYILRDRYNNDLSEIKAEAMGIYHTYEFLKENFPDKDADKLISDLVNCNISHYTYFISGHYTNIDEILDAFDEQYEKAKTADIEYPDAWKEPVNDEAYQYLIWCKNNNCPVVYYDFIKKHDAVNKDLLMASITCHIHPEIPYERLYPCLLGTDLSSKTIFGYNLPVPPKDMFIPFDTDKMQNRIELADRINTEYMSENVYEEEYDDMEL